MPWSWRQTSHIQSRSSSKESDAHDGEIRTNHTSQLYMLQYVTLFDGMLLVTLHMEPALSRANFIYFQPPKTYSIDFGYWLSFLVIWCDFGDIALGRLRRDQPGSPTPPCWQFRVHRWLSRSVVTWTDPNVIRPSCDLRSIWHGQAFW